MNDEREITRLEDIIDYSSDDAGQDEGVVEQETEVVETPEEEVVQTEPAQVVPEQPMVNENRGADYDAAMRMAQEQQRYAQIEAENASLREQLTRERSERQAATQAANENVAEQVTEMPVLDMDELMYASDEDRNRIVSEYNNKLIAIAAKQATAEMLGKISPLMQQYDAAVLNDQFSRTMGNIKTMKGFEDVEEHADFIRSFSERPEFASMTPEQRFTLSAFVERGMRNAMPAPAPATPDVNAQADAILANPELMKVLTQKQMSAVQAKNENVPMHIAGGGFANAVMQPQKKAETMEEIIKREGGYY